jgi:hypothetical protein
MSGIDAPGGWSTEQIHAHVWLKWRLAESPAVPMALASAQRATTPLELLDATSDEDGSYLAAAADAQVLLGDWPAAMTAYERAVELDATQPIPLIGRAVVAIHQGCAATAVDDLRSLRAARPDDPVVAHYLALALVCRATEVRAINRDGRSVIISAAQLDECEHISGELADLAVDDPELVPAVAALAQQVGDSRAWTWRGRGGNGGVLAFVVLLSAIGVVGSGLVGNLWLVIAAALFGAGGVFLYVVTHRRPAWELGAQALVSMGTERGS